MIATTFLWKSEPTGMMIRPSTLWSMRKASSPPRSYVRLNPPFAVKGLGRARSVRWSHDTRASLMLRGTAKQHSILGKAFIWKSLHKGCVSHNRTALLRREEGKTFLRDLQARLNAYSMADYYECATVQQQWSEANCERAYMVCLPRVNQVQATSRLHRASRAPPLHSQGSLRNSPPEDCTSFESPPTLV